MGNEFPEDEHFYVLKQDRSLGPFSADELIEQIDEGAFHYDDLCLRNGDTECRRLKEVLDWDEQPPPNDGPADETEESVQLEEEPASAPEPGSILYHGHPSLASYPLPFLGLIGGIVAGIWLFPVNVWLSVTAGAVSILSLVSLSLRRVMNDYFVTPRRIELVSGLIARSSNEVRIADIRAINVTCSGLIGALGIGTVDFFTAGDDPEVTFKNVWAAKKVKALVRKLQDAPP